MTSDRDKPGVAFWATVVLVVGLVAYPLSYGPTCWIFWRLSFPRWLGNTIQYAYAPLHMAIEIGPDWPREWRSRYLDWWVPPVWNPPMWKRSELRPQPISEDEASLFEMAE